MSFWKWIAIAVLLVGSFFVAKVPFGAELALVSAVSIVVFAIPMLEALRRWLGDAKAIGAFVVLGLFAIAIEATSVTTGFPYSQFVYGDQLGGKLGGLVPWTVPFAWLPVLVGAAAVVATMPALRKNAFVFSISTAVVTMIIDLVLDPGATALQFWIWNTPGSYYGVPIVNFAGWVLSGFIGSLMLWQLGGSPTAHKLLPAFWGLLGVLVFWTSVAGWLGLVIPCVLGLLLTILGYMRIRLFLKNPPTA